MKQKLAMIPMLVKFGYNDLYNKTLTGRYMTQSNQKKQLQMFLYTNHKLVI